MVTKEDYTDWKKHPVTEALYAALIERINEGAKELATSAGISPLEDRFKCGIIHAYHEILTVELDEIEGASDNA